MAALFEQQLVALKQFGHGRAVFGLEPYARLKAAGAYCVRSGLQSVREHFGIGYPVAAALAPFQIAPAVPAGIHNHKVDFVTAYAICDLYHVFMRRIAPCGAVFVEQHGQLFIAAQPVFALHREQPLGRRVHAAAPRRYVCFGRFKAFARVDRAAPAARLIVRQAYRHAQPFTLTAQFALPRAGAGQLYSPRHARLFVLYRRKREPAAHGHGADLSKLFYAHTIARPGRLQMHALHAFAVQPALGAPRAVHAVHGQRAHGVRRCEGRDIAHVHAGKQVQRQRLIGIVFKRR